MTSAQIKKTIALSAAVTTTLVLFSAVVSIASEDKRALAAARAGTTEVAAVDSPRIVR